MSDDDTKVPLPELDGDVQVVQDAGTLEPSDSEPVDRGAADLEAMFDVPVQVSAVLGRAHMEVGNLFKLGPGAVLELDRKVSEAIDVCVNNRVVARSGTDVAAHAAMAAEQVTRNLVGRTVAEVERDLILETLKHCLGNRTHAANILGISIRTLRNKLNEYAADGAPIPPPHGGEPLQGAA
jgi:flagellar motor switch protein FliN